MTQDYYQPFKVFYLTEDGPQTALVKAKGADDARAYIGSWGECGRVTRVVPSSWETFSALREPVHTARPVAV